MINLVIFDLDGTLYDYDSCNSRAEEALFQEINRRFGTDTNHAKMLLSEAKIRVHNHLGDTASSHNRVLYMQDICERLSTNPFKHVLDLYNVYWDCILDSMQPFDYVIPLFKDLKKKRIKIGILTDLTAYIQFRKINRLGIDEYIDYLVTSEEAGNDKPDKKGFSLILEKADVKAGDALMVGDNRILDIEGADALGIQTYWYNGQSEVKNDIINLAMQ